MTDLNRDTGDPWRRGGARDVRNGDHFTTADTPLGDLIAGRIGQAEYRRRMADLERRAADSLDAEPAPARRAAPEPERSGAGCVWVAVAFVLALTFALGVLVGSSIAAPRGAQTTDLVPPRDMSASAVVSSSGLPSVPPAAVFSGPAAEDAPRQPSGGASPSAEARTELLGDTVAAARRISGLATWYCLSGSSVCTRGYGQDDLVAAIDTDLGFVKGDRITVRYREAEVTVTVVDVCGCPGDRLIDLTSGAFARLAPLDLGVIPVTIEAAGPNFTLPPTDARP